jgi:hypothetical protein
MFSFLYNISVVLVIYKCIWRRPMKPNMVQVQGLTCSEH